MSIGNKTFGKLLVATATLFAVQSSYAAVTLDEEKPDQAAPKKAADKGDKAKPQDPFGAPPAAQRIVKPQQVPPVRAVPALPFVRASRRFSGNGLEGVQVKIFKSNGKRIRYKKSKTEMVRQEQTYHVRVPFVENGETKFKTEKRTRTVARPKLVEKNALVPVDFTFETIDGRKVDHAEANKIMGDQETAVLEMPEGKKIPKLWQKVLKPDTLVFRTKVENNPVPLPAPALGLPPAAAAPPAQILKVK